MIKKLLALLLCLFTPVASIACVEGIPAITQALSSVSNALATLHKVDALVGVFFGSHPDVPSSERNTYLMLYDGAITALTEYQRTAEATNDLRHGDTKAAFDKFEATYSKLAEWLTTHGLLSGGNLMLDGKLLSELPPAASFKR